MTSSLGCINATANIIGSKWSAQIIRELADGPQRYCDIERGVAGINPRILSQRLTMLSEHNIITEHDHYYLLTSKGRDLVPILQQMADWARKYPGQPSSVTS